MLNIVMLSAVTCHSTIHTYCIVTFPLLQWLHEHATVLCVRCLSCYKLPTLHETVQNII